MNGIRLLALALLLGTVFSSHTRASEVHRSPMAISISPDRSVCLTANFTAGTVSLIDLSQMTVVDEIAVGRTPCDIAWINRETALVTLQRDDAVAVIRCNKFKLEKLTTIPVGDEPNSVSVTPEQHRAFVALGGEDAVIVLDLRAPTASKNKPEVHLGERIPVGGIPKTLAVSPDGKWLVTCCAVPCEVFVHDTESLKEISARKVFDGGFNPGNPAVTADSQIVVLPSAVNRAFSVTAGMIDIGWVIDNRLTKLLLPDAEPSDQKQLGLDIRGKAVGDANAATFSPDGQLILVTCGGTHELLVLDFPTIPWPSGDPGDFLPEPLRKDPARYRRIKLGGRPVDVQFFSDNQAVIANYLSDSLQVVDITTDTITHTIPLGGPEALSLVRQGEIVFYDADRSLHSWFSCHTCHPDGHTSGQVFDTRNDKTYGTPKLIPSLRGVADTGPWTWHGWQTDLKDAMRRSLTESMNTEKPISEEDVDALAAYMSTIDLPENPRAQSASPTVELGKRLFEGRAGCAKCHSGSTFTASESFDGAVVDPKDTNKKYNPPSLRGVSTRRRFLHTGKAKNLEQVLTKFHRPEDVVGESLNDTETAALIDYLKSL